MMNTTTRMVTDPALRHKDALENLLEARTYYESCPEQERATALLLLDVAYLNERDARQAWVHALTGDSAASN